MGASYPGLQTFGYVLFMHFNILWSILFLQKNICSSFFLHIYIYVYYHHVLHIFIIFSRIPNKNKLKLKFDSLDVRVSPLRWLDYKPIVSSSKLYTNNKQTSEPVLNSCIYLTFELSVECCCIVYFFEFLAVVGVVVNAYCVVLFVRSIVSRFDNFSSIALYGLLFFFYSVGCWLSLLIFVVWFCLLDTQMCIYM